jgi:putative phage-type endonuclease
MTAETVAEAVVVAHVDADTERERWLELRRQGIGGSDVAAICGVSAYASALKVWLEKLGQLPEQEDNERMFWGRMMEPLVADVLAERTEVRLHKVPMMLAHREHPWMLASLDRLADCDVHGAGIGEIKTGGYFTGPDWADDQIPDPYKLQGLHYMAVTGLPYVLFGALIGGQRLEVRWLYRDDELIAHLLTIEAEFWQMVEEQTPPPPDGSKATTDLLAHLWDVQAGLIRTMDPAEVAPLVAQHHAWSAMARHAEERQREVDNRLRWMLGEGVEAVDPDGRKLYTWKPDKRGIRTLRFPKVTSTSTPIRKAIT